MARRKTNDAVATDAATATAEGAEREAERRKKVAEDATAAADEAGKLPESSAITNPAPAKRMEASGAFVEEEIQEAVPLDHPSVDNNPRAGTSAIQNGQDFNDPRRRKPGDKDFAGQGLDPVPYGQAADKK